MRHRSTGSVLDPTELDMLASQWSAQRGRPLESLDWKPRLVPYSELPEPGAGGLIAAAIRERLQTDGHSEDVSFSVSSGKACMNCGSSRPEVSELGGWCARCSNA